MRHRLTTTALALLAGLLFLNLPAAGPTTAAAAECPDVLDHEMRPLAGADPVPLCETYRGKVLLVVNTASRCGFTPQFEGLEALYREYGDDGLVVLGFPSNDFRQELAEESDIKGFCELNYGVSFPMFQKIRVRGPEAHPFYRDLAAAARTEPSWNFHKFLIDRSGRVVDAYPSMVTPQDARLVGTIERLLGEAG